VAYSFCRERVELNYIVGTTRGWEATAQAVTIEVVEHIRTGFSKPTNITSQ